ncbi:hypothetical protein GCAAIG_14235 [Candidatus Electronema halotolerans]
MFPCDTTAGCWPQLLMFQQQLAAGIAHAVPVAVLLIYVGDERAVVADIADMILVAVLLLRVVDVRAVVNEIRGGSLAAIAVSAPQQEAAMAAARPHPAS